MWGTYSMVAGWVVGLVVDICLSPGVGRVGGGGREGERGYAGVFNVAVGMFLQEAFGNSYGAWSQIEVYMR